MNAASNARTALPAILIIGASTGGPRVLSELLGLLPPLRAGVLIVQHLPLFINPSFVRTLGRQTRAEVRLAQTGDRLAPGLVLVAPSEVHCRVVGNSSVRLDPGPRVNFVCPSIDVAMQSLGAPASGSKLAGVLLTGMGRDGADGMAHIKRLGGMTIAQNAATCAVYGMPAEAVKLGCIDFELPPDRIARLLAQELGG